MIASTFDDFAYHLYRAYALTEQGWQVLHIQSKKTAKPRELTPFLQVQGGKLIYLAPPDNETQ
ncbi:MAG TPA: hypothetical protein VF043_25810 [Ktedonobacteraceae bacterium]